MGLGHALDVCLVDDRLVVGRPRRAVGCPLEERVDDHAGHGVAQRIHHRRGSTRGLIGFPIFTGGRQVVGEQRLAEVEFAVEGLAIRIEQQLAGIAAVPGRGIPRPVHPEAVALTRGHRRQIGVPDVSVDLVEVDPLLGAVLGDQAQFDFVGHLGEQRKVGPRTVIGGAQRVGAPGPDGRHRNRFGGRHQPTHQPVAAPSWRPSSLVMVRMYVADRW